jgi:phage repressor protein C with HTH and peptisase S24 domain
MSKMAKDLGIPESTIPFLTVAGRLPAAATARTVANYLGVSTEWLYTGKGPVTNEIHKEIDADSHTTDTINRNSIETPNNEICLYDVSAAAGRGSFDEIIQKDKLVDKFVIPAFHDVSWMIYVKGSSMYPKYSSGDIIACRVLNDSKFIQWGKVYVVATKEQGLLVKRLKKSEREDCITAISDNTIYDPFDIPKDEILGLALVLGVIRME